VLEACAQREGWSSKVAAAIEAALGFAVADPAAANLLTNEALAHGAAGFARYQRLISYMAEHLLSGRGERSENARLPQITERALASGVATLVAQRLDKGREDELSTLAPEIVQFVLTPYVGAEQARRQASGANR
jgi:hypothetical protein